MNHLTDEKILSYLDGILSSQEKKNIESHVIKCQACQCEIASYKALYSSLREEIGLELNAKFSLNVLLEIQNQILGNIQEKLLTFFAVLFGVIAVLTTSFYYVDFSNIGNDLKIEIPGLALPNFSGIIGQFQHLLSETGFNFSLLLVGAFVLIALGAFDRFVLQSKYRISSR